MADTSDDKGKDSQAEQTSKPEPPQSTDNSKKSTDSETQPSSQALEEKQKGNEAYKKKDFTTAHLHYDKAIELDPTEIIFRNNKAAVYFEQKDYDRCIEVSEEAITIGRENRADYTLIAKALARAGKAYLKKKHDDNALRYLQKSLSEHRTTETKNLCYEVDKRMKEKKRHAYLDPEKTLEAKTLGNEHFKKGPSGSQAIGSTFGNPDLMQRLEANPKTREYLKQPDYRMMIEILQQNPNNLQNIQDPRIIQTLSVLASFDLEQNRSDTSDDKGKDSHAEQTSKPEPPHSTDNSKKSTDSETQPSSQALEEKLKGNEAYKKKDFTTAHLHYDKAIELDPTEIIFRNNKAAVYFEQKDYDKCTEVSEEAITIGTENGADHTLIAKALARAGKAYFKKEDDDNALRYLHKSLSEHRITETQKLCYEEANLGYRDSRIAEGNDPEAVRKRAMADPEVTQILKDPAMQTILQQMEKDPKAVGDHLKNPEVADKIEKLMECAIFALR